MKNKKIVCILAVCALTSLIFTGCKGTNDSSTDSSTTNETRVINSKMTKDTPENVEESSIEIYDSTMTSIEESSVEGTETGIEITNQETVEENIEPGDVE